MPNESPEDRIMLAVGYHVGANPIGGRTAGIADTLQAPWYANRTQRLFLPLEHANFFMKHNDQPVEVRANFLEKEDMQQLRRNYDFTFEPSVPVDRKSQAKL